MKRVFLLPLIAAIGFGAAIMPGCNKSAAPAIPTSVMQAIINGCTAACKFIPEVESVSQLLSAAPWVGTVENAVNLLCEAFAKWQAANPAPLAESLKNQVKSTAFDVTLTNGTVLHVKGQFVR